MAGEQPDPRLQGLVSEALAELKKKSLEHEAKCGFLKVDFLALKRFIENFVTEQEQRVYKGQPEVSLDSLVLTSEFQIIFDATAGTQHLLRILPVLQPPVLGLAPDHTHSLKLTFAGGKARGLLSNAESLRQKCLDRLQTFPQGEAEAICGKAETILLESLIEAVESIKPSAG